MSERKRVPLRDPLVSMKTLSGYCPLPTLPPTVGRIGGVGTGARIAVAERPPFQLEEHTVAVICIGEPFSPTDCPVPLLFLEGLPSDCIGKIALLDPSCGRLFVSPDLITLDRYACRLSRRGESSTPFAKRTPRLSPANRNGQELTVSESNGALLHAADLGGRSEEERLERLCALAEVLPRRTLTVLIEPSSRSALLSNLHTWVRSVFLASVYGRFSLLIGGAVSARELSCALREIWLCFCELEAEGREFNGYISKGVLIDTPLLLSARTMDGVDRICYDLYKLSRFSVGDHLLCEDDWAELSSRLADHSARHCHASSSYLLYGPERNGAQLPLHPSLLPLFDSAEELFLRAEDISALGHALDDYRQKKESYPLDFSVEFGYNDPCTKYDVTTPSQNRNKGEHHGIDRRSTVAE